MASIKVSRRIALLNAEYLPTIDADSGAAPFLKAAVRDVKAYRDAQKMRQIPVGYCASDVSGLYANLRDYLSCGGDNATTIDFFGLDDYSWCDPNSLTSSGYADLYKGSLDYPLPLFFSETECKLNNRSFDNQIAILGPQMNQKWSGSIMYYGLGGPANAK